MPLRRLRALYFVLLFASAAFLNGCGSGISAAEQDSVRLQAMKSPLAAADPLANYTQTGTVAETRDPSIMRQGKMYYAYVTGGTLGVRCSPDLKAWKACGTVFPTIPAWAQQRHPGINALWAPDISYFNGLYHLYYVISKFGFSESSIGFATNTTLDPNDPKYKWVDQGEVLSSEADSGWNALDPNILVDTDGRVWLTYGSYFQGILQREIDPATGKLMATNSGPYLLAQRPDVSGDPIEGASLIHHGNYYYLFVSVDACCNADQSKNNYKEAMGRSTSPHGPFVSMAGDPMTEGYSTVLLRGNGTSWYAPGGGTVNVDSQTGDTLITFHGLKVGTDGMGYLWVKRFTWVNDWPILE